MRGSLPICFTFVVMGALVVMAATDATAGTIIKLSLGNDSASSDIEFDGTTLSTRDDSGAGTGDQQTNAEFLDFLSSETNISDGTGSFTLDNLVTDGAAQTFGGFLVIQNFTGGIFNLYDGANVLLLSGTLDDSSLTGPIGLPATGALFTTSFGSVTSGTLASQIDPDSLTLSITFTDINDGAGFSTSGVMPNESLNSFTADATVIIAAEPIPEPATAVLVLLAALMAGTWAGRR